MAASAPGVLVCGRRPISVLATAPINTDPPATAKIVGTFHWAPTIWPTTNGPVTDQSRPIPVAQPTPVERIATG